MKTEDHEELIQAARVAAEPTDWDRIAAYFDEQRAQVTPREVRDNQPDRGDH